jgi:hypothetical protein
LRQEPRELEGSAMEIAPAGKMEQNDSRRTRATQGKDAWQMVPG